MKVCMVAYAFYETDNRVRRYAEALAKRGDYVEAVSLRREGLPAFEVINGVRVHRIQPRQINEKGKFTHVSRLIQFFLRSMAFLTKSHLKERYDLIHVHSVPDFEVFAALFAKLGGAKVILDIHDIMPEFYVSKFNSTHDSLAFKILLTIERLSTRFADHVIAANHIWGDRLVTRSVPEFQVHDVPQLSRFIALSAEKRRSAQRRQIRHAVPRHAQLSPGSRPRRPRLLARSRIKFPKPNFISTAQVSSSNIFAP